MRWPELDDLARPRWRADVPALWRDPTTMQLGDDIVVDNVSSAMLTWLRTLDGATTADRVMTQSTVPPEQARRLLRALRSAGALVDGAVLPATQRFDHSRRDRLRVMEGAVDQHLDPGAAHAAIARREAARVFIQGDGALRDAIAHVLDDVGLTEVAVVTKATVAVLADAHHPDVPAQFDGPALDLPHLHVAAHGARAVAGPLVVPGSTSCLRCAHLHLRDADATWPVLSVQWSQSVPRGGRADPLLVRAVATHAVHLLRAWLDSPDTRSRWADHAYTWRLGELLPALVHRPPHPLCGCRWGA